MPLHLRQLIPCPPGSSLEGELLALPPLPGRGGEAAALLLGGAGSGKTALLFQYALGLAQEGKEVYFVTRQGKVEAGFPLVPEPVGDKAAVLQRIKIRYLEDSKGLRKLAACMHLVPSQPEALIVDDIHDFLAPGDAKHDLARTLASLKEAALCLSRMHGRGCALLVSGSSQDEACAAIFIARRWLSTLLSLEGPEEGGAHTLRLHPSHTPAGGLPGAELRLVVSSSHAVQLQAVVVAP